MTDELKKEVIVDLIPFIREFDKNEYNYLRNISLKISQGKCILATILNSERFEEVPIVLYLIGYSLYEGFMDFLQELIDIICFSDSSDNLIELLQEKK